MSMTSEFAPGSNVLLLFKCELQEERNKLTRAIDSIHKEIRTLADSGPDDLTDECSGSSSKETVFASHSRNRTQLREVELALKRLAAGDFGICTACGGDIGLKRLQALPWASTCIECQEQSEQGRVQ